MSEETSKDFCLLDECWLPVRLTDGRSVELGLLETFRRSSEIAALGETSPPSLVAQYRLLLAITHRALSHDAPALWTNQDRARWYREGLPVERIRDYLEHWLERFWLFHPRYPFMQVAALASAEETKNKRKPWMQIALASASGNAPLLFDHARDDAPVRIRPAEALSLLLGYLQFTPGGLVKTLRDSDKAGALANTAAIVPIGETLAKTLCLNLHPAPTGNEAAPDLPAWEREPLTIPQLRGNPVLATGPNDRYTRQSRAVLLLRETDGNIRWLRFAAGLALGEDVQASDPMASFRAGQNGLVRLTFTEGRAFWRDLPALVPNPSGNTQAAAVLNYAIGLYKEETFDAIFQPLLVAGLASDQAKLLRWRLEQIALPAALLEDADKALYLRKLVALAEDLFKSASNVMVSMLAATQPTSSSKDARNRARDLLQTGPFTSSYFSLAERALPQLLSLLGEGNIETANELWCETLRNAARKAWDRVLIGLGCSAPALRAEAQYRHRFYGVLKKYVPQPESTTVKEV